jgi:hypothetical protein
LAIVGADSSPKSLQGLVLELADALVRQAQPVAYLTKGLLTATVQAKAFLENPMFPGGEGRQGDQEKAFGFFPVKPVGGSRMVLIGQGFSHGRMTVVQAGGFQ